MRDEPVDDLALVDELFKAEPVPLPPTHRVVVRRRIGRICMITGGILGLLVLAYIADLVASIGDVPRGVTVAGVEVGGLGHANAEAKLRRELQPRLVQPVAITAGDASGTLDPPKSGLGIDWPGTLAQAGHQPLNPVDRVLAFFRKREVGVVAKVDQDLLTRSVTKLAAQFTRDPVEGGIGFRETPDRVEAYAIEPRPGQALRDIDGAVSVVKDEWLGHGGVRLGVEPSPVKATTEGVHRALDQIVTPALASPITVHGDGQDFPLMPTDLSHALKFEAREGGTLDVLIDQPSLEKTLQPQLAVTEKPGKDAQFVFGTGAPAIEPAEDGRKVDWAKTFEPLAEVMKRADGRELTAVYAANPAALTTDAAGALGISEVVGEFTTSGFSGPAATNIGALAAKVNGMIVKPGDTFSLSALGSPGYVNAPLNEDGTGPIVVGGGVSQFASTLYNAAYLAGLTDVSHVTHDYYLDRYPAGREAKILNADGSGADLKFGNDGTSGVAIQAYAGGSSVTVKLWGTKRFRVEGSAGGQSDVIEAPVQYGSGDGCQPSAGVPGFTTSDTRVVREIGTGQEVRRETRVVRYQPRAAMVCG
ncbi:Vancomycin resistance protein YoaR, contains peptidoglycan-binding and VanW domains [Amycolatopsis xylanica]|uniref:Vancomycin resistance protein YoaR, contains peptidoglycan-binding and VanW domains n=1 Tax=Amycolatopsis xylanica TaxID=589385 RepID=A0A1H3ABD3_9PSEU|nr:VanW family protein [Amycolatopsis xylanica]SDX27027.1 Vancomycin resistance protein YoaR, contains peptidoglycan-binding and VanW domains [Amycolatopsis xylanica]